MIDRLQVAGYTFEHPAHLNESDVDDLLVIEKEAFPIDFYNREELLEEYEANPFLFAIARKLDTNPVGYVSGDIQDEVGKVMSIAVDKNMRGKGIGTYLTGIMVDYLKSAGVQRIEAYTRADNIASQIILGRFGLAVVETVQDYYRDKAPALLLRARI